MPISTNAPFDEFGQSMILRDIERLDLLNNKLNAAVSALESNLANTNETLSGVSADGIPTSNLTVYTSGSGTHTITPAGASRVLACMVGGGSGTYTGSALTIGYVAGSSGAAADRPVTIRGRYGGGGGGLIVLIDVSGLTSLTYAVGAAGAASGTPTAGGNTTLSDGTFTCIATGGSAPDDQNPGVGGSPYITSISSRILWGFGFPGHQGSFEMENTVFAWNTANGFSYPGIRPLFSGISIDAGNGGRGGDGNAGALAILGI